MKNGNDFCLANIFRSQLELPLTYPSPKQKCGHCGGLMLVIDWPMHIKTCSRRSQYSIGGITQFIDGSPITS